MNYSRLSIVLSLSIFTLAACSSSGLVIDPEFNSSAITPEEVLSGVPDYEGDLTSAKGKGRALISEPGNSERISIEFESDSVLSLLTIKNRIGIEGGKMLVDSDSILIYNKIDKYAQKVSVTDGRLTSLNELASVNLLDLLNFKVRKEGEVQVFESESFFMLRWENDTRVYIAKEDNLIREVRQRMNSGLPYSRIIYEDYGVAEGYTLPRKITIFSSNGESKVLFQIRDLDVNATDLNLTLDIPAEIPIRRL